MRGPDEIIDGEEGAPWVSWRDWLRRAGVAAAAYTLFLGTFEAEAQNPHTKKKGGSQAQATQPKEIPRESVHEFFYDPAGQTTLDIASAVPPSGRSLVWLPLQITVQGRDARIVIPCPLDQFVEQRRLWSRVQAFDASGRPLQLGTQYTAEKVISKEGQPFFYVRVLGIGGNVTINADSILSLADEIPRANFENTLRTLPFGVGTRESNIPFLKTEDRQEGLLRTFAQGTPKDVHPLRALQRTMDYVHRSMRYEGTVTHEHPYDYLLKRREGHCGVYGACLAYAAQNLEREFGMDVFLAGGWWEKSPHVKNGIVVHVQDPSRASGQVGSVSPRFLFADATKNEFSSQGDHMFVTCSIDAPNTFDPLPSGERPPGTSASVNTASLAQGTIVEHLHLNSDLSRSRSIGSAPLPAETKVRIAALQRQAEEERRAINSGRRSPPGGRR